MGKKGLQRIAIYYRVSTDRQDLISQQTTVEQWLEDLKEDQKPKSVKVYQDEGISGTTNRRPMFQEMMKDAYCARFDTLVVYRLDRFSRNATSAIKLLLDLDEVGVAFISVTQPVLNLGHENPFRRTMLAAFAEIAEIERDTIVTRVKAGLDAARKKGKKLGAPTKIDPILAERAKTLKEDGHTLREISTELGVSLGSIHRILNI
jgi:DNA invertase Pin-like site-specific DNA recombinase